MTGTHELLRQYDDVLRPYEMQTPSALRRERIGPVVVGHYDGGRAFVTYRDLGGRDEGGVRALVDEESVMIGPVEALTPYEPPAGVTVRQVVTEAEVRAAEAAAAAVFGSPPEVERRIADELVRRVLAGEALEMWVAEAEGAIVSSGRLEPVPGTPFAGIWGGSTRPDWRRRGVYRALTAARARSAAARGVRYIHSDSTEESRPILERSGFVRVTTTTPYEWSRPT